MCETVLHGDQSDCRLTVATGRVDILPGSGINTHVVVCGTHHCAPAPHLSSSTTSIRINNSNLLSNSLLSIVYISRYFRNILENGLKYTAAMSH